MPTGRLPCQQRAANIVAEAAFVGCMVGNASACMLLFYVLSIKIFRLISITQSCCFPPDCLKFLQAGDYFRVKSLVERNPAQLHDDGHRGQFR